MAVDDFADVSESYAHVRPGYEALARSLGDTLRERLAQSGIPAIVVWRAKDVLSFTKKALRKGYQKPMAEIGDKAGVRVIVDFEADVQPTRALIQDLGEVLSEESKLDAMAYHELGYLGVHLQLRVSGAPANACEAEVQIHTRAQSAWAVVSHDLLYKSPHELSDNLKRRITRLVALVELFDGEVARLRQAIENDPDHDELSLIAPLDDEIVRFTARRPDRALSAVLVPPLARIYQSPVADIYGAFVRPFIETNEQKLTDLFSAYRNDERANPLLFQPEALLVFELLARDPDRLRDAWTASPVPLELLDSLATIWGVAL